MMIAVVVVLVLLVFIIVGMYNSLVGLKVQCDNAWSDIDVQLKRRYDLIPNLVETVKGYAAHEKGTLEDVVAARNRAMSS
jgi:LemA protein